jgi:hypothetical protein
MKVGDLVYEAATGRYGIVERIYTDYHGASQAFKVVGAKRGDCIGPNSVNTILPTREGKRDRVMVCWTDSLPEYLESHELEVVNEAW